MPRILKRRPSPAMIVALIALFCALAGTVYAAGQIDGHIIERGSLPGNRIADDTVTGKQVKELTLGQVRNADSVGGIRSTAFSRAASSATDSNAIPPGGHEGTARQVTLTAPQSGFLLAIATAGLSNASDVSNYTCVLRLDGVNQPQSARKGFLDFLNQDPRENEQTCDTASLFPVTRGAHTVQFNFSDMDNNTVVGAAELDLVFIPFGG